MEVNHVSSQIFTITYITDMSVNDIRKNKTVENF